MSRKKNILRLLSLVFGFFLWFYVISSSVIEATKRVRVTYLLPKGYTSSEYLPQIIEQKISGPRAVVNNILSDEQTVEVDLTKRMNKSKRLSFNPVELVRKLPFAVTLLETKPEKIDVKLVKKMIKKIRVEAKYEGVLDSSLRLTSIEPLVKHIYLTGPKEALDKFDVFSLGAVKLGEIKKDTVLKFDVKVEDPRVSLSEKSIEVKVVVESELKEFYFEAIELQFKSDKSFDILEDHIVNAYIEASKNIDLKEVQKGIKAYLDLRGLKPGEHIVQLNFDLPKGMTLVKSSVEKMRVKIK